MKMEKDFLERRREINRRAARKSRSRQKELAINIRKKFYEAQSAHTKLVYERKQLERERNQLKTLLETHRCSFKEGHGDLTRRPSFNKSHSVIEAYAALSHLGRSVSCPAPSRNLDDNDDDDDDDDDYDDDDDGIEEMSVSSEDGSSSKSSTGENNSSSPLEMASNFTELGINSELFVPSSDEAFLSMSGLPQNPEDDGSEFLLDRCNDAWSDIFDGIMQPIVSPLPPVIESEEDVVITTEPNVLVPCSVEVDDENNETISWQTSKIVELRLETGQHPQSEALDLSKRGPLSPPIRRVSSSECSKSVPTTPLVVEHKINSLSRTLSKEPAGVKSTSPADRLFAENTKDKQEFQGNIPLLVESFIVGEKY